MKLITFSLWGHDPKYLVGAIKNADLAKKIYPDWLCRFYVGQSIPFSVIHELKSRDNVQVVEKAEFGDWKGMFWRFEAIDEADVEVMISRDADSRLNYREKAAVDQWIESDKGFHIMRDHPWHRFPVLGGMWGIKSGILPSIRELINDFGQEDAYGTDYKFLADVVLPRIEDDTLVHDEFFEGTSFPTLRQDNEFVGQIFDENDNTVEEHVNILKEALK
tara:strand:+ start:9056 stop:9712 length:657 start_codon:yes stop_codon:yes gene_type:complete